LNIKDASFSSSLCPLDAPTLICGVELSISKLVVFKRKVSVPKVTFEPLTKAAEAVICPLAPFNFNVPEVESKSLPILNPPIVPV
jgi:hypothetical protein